jgi:hypothetical protein
MTTGRINQIAPMGSTAKHHQERPKAPTGGLQELFPHVKTSAKLATHSADHQQDEPVKEPAADQAGVFPNLTYSPLGLAGSPSSPPNPSAPPLQASREGPLGAPGVP